MTPQIEALKREAETGADWAEICRLEAEAIDQSSIRVSEWPFAGNFYAVRDDTYDGPGCPIGSGKTPEAAVADLLECEESR